MTQSSLSQPPHYELGSIKVQDIEVGERLRLAGDKRISALAASMQELGLRTPISVRIMKKMEATGQVMRPVLVAGATRLAAAKKLGWQRIDCFILSPNDLDAQLWEIDENLARVELTPAEMAEHMARRKDLWERKLTMLNGARCPIFQGAGRGHKGFAQDTADKTGHDKRNVNKAVARGKRIASDVLREIKGTKLDTGVSLDKLAKLSPHEQRAAIKIGIDGAPTAQTTGQSSRVAKQKADDRIAELLARYVPDEYWDALMDNLCRAGYKALAQVFGRLISGSIADYPAEARPVAAVASEREQQEDFLRHKMPPPPTIDDVVRFLRQLGDIVFRKDDHYLLNYSLPLTPQELVAHANRKTKASGKPPFELPNIEVRHLFSPSF